MTRPHRLAALAALQRYADALKALTFVPVPLLRFVGPAPFSYLAFNMTELAGWVAPLVYSGSLLGPLGSSYMARPHW